jgi:hypothetical protein
MVVFHVDAFPFTVLTQGSTCSVLLSSKCFGWIMSAAKYDFLNLVARYDDPAISLCQFWFGCSFLNAVPWFSIEKRHYGPLYLLV